MESLDADGRAGLIDACHESACPLEIRTAPKPNNLHGVKLQTHIRRIRIP